MLKLNLQYFSHLMREANSLEKILILAKIEGRRRRGWQRMRWLDGVTDSIGIVWASSRRQWRTRKPGVLQSLGLQRVGYNLATKHWPRKERRVSQQHLRRLWFWVASTPPVFSLWKLLFSWRHTDSTEEHLIYMGVNVTQRGMQQ